MNLKKYLLAGGLSTVLLLGACGGGTSEEESAEEENAEETEEASEDTQGLEEENDELKAQNQELQDQVATLEAELEATHEESEDDNTENDLETESTEEDDNDIEESSDDIEVIKESPTEFENQYDTINVELLDARVSSMTISEEDLWMFEINEPGEHDYVVLDFEVTNTVDEPRDFFLSFTEMVTNTNQQIESDAGASQGLQNDMLGEVTSEGQVLFFIEPGTGEDIEWIDLQIPPVFDGGSIDRMSDEDTVRIEFE